MIRSLATSAITAFLALAAAASSRTDDMHPPIPIPFGLPRAGFATLVIEDAEGKRVRNLVAETEFPAGDNVVWWDGLDESGQVWDGKSYRIESKLVEPGSYYVRGLYHRGIDLRHEFSVYTGGDPPWRTEDTRGRWLADHSPASDVLYVPGDPRRVLIVSSVAEAGDGLVAVDLKGRKLWGKRHIGGSWTGAELLARDTGPRAVPGVYGYTGIGWRTGRTKRDELDQSQLRLLALREDGEEPVVSYRFQKRVEVHWRDTLTGLAVHNGTMVCSLPESGELLFIATAANEVLGRAPVEKPGGLAFDAGGRLLALAGTELHRYALPAEIAGPFRLPAPEVLVREGLDDPKRIALDERGSIYVSDWGASHQVKVFSPEGTPLRTIGTAGGPKVGAYDPTRMASPKGLTITPDGRLWVAERSYTPKRVSVWTLDGKFVRAFYGPPSYGGGGYLDPMDRTRFYYAKKAHGIEFRLDWKKGAFDVASIYWLPGPGDLQIGSAERAPDFNYPGPQTPIHCDGRLYLTNGDNTHPYRGSSVVGIWLLRDDIAVPVAAVGIANQWHALWGEELRERLPDGIDLSEKQQSVLFAWSDLDGDARVQPSELTFRPGHVYKEAMYVMPDLSVTTTFTECVVPEGFTDGGAPIYDASKAAPLAPGARDHVKFNPWSCGQVIRGGDDWVVLTGQPMRGYRRGRQMWTYPNCWTQGKGAPKPSAGGEITNAKRLLGLPVTPRGSDIGEIWAVNGYFGCVYLMSTDGLFVGTLFRDQRIDHEVPARARRGMVLNDTTLLSECFWPSITQTADGRIYLHAGKEHCGIVRVEGLESIRRLEAGFIQVTPELLAQARAYRTRLEQQRQESEESTTLTVALRQAAPAVDGQLAEWDGASWATIDDKTQASVALAGDRLYAAFRSEYRGLLDNTPESVETLFKSGGALDLMVATDAGAAPGRRAATAGDIRLLVATADRATTAALYRAVVPGTREPVMYTSPVGDAQIDRVEDVSAEVKLASGSTTVEQRGRRTRYYTYELSVPLAVLGLAAQPGTVLRGDIGILRGSAGQTVERIYWHNKATGLTADLPSEARLTPQLWGQWRFTASP